MKHISRLVILLLFVLCSIEVLAQAPAKPSFVGTWKLNLAKSTYSPGPVPKSQVATISAVSGGMKVISDRVEADGAKVHFEWMAKFDGTDYPVKGDPSRDTVSVKKIDAYNLEFVNKKGGKVTTTTRAAYAKDGKTRIETVTGVNSKGQEVKNVTFWDKR